MPSLNSVKVIAAGLLALALCAAVWHYKSTLEENKRLKASVMAANGTIENLDKKAVSENKITETSDNIINEVRNAPKEDDAVVAPVLDRAIDRLDGMRAHR